MHISFLPRAMYDECQFPALNLHGSIHGPAVGLQLDKMYSNKLLCSSAGGKSPNQWILQVRLSPMWDWTSWNYWVMPKTGSKVTTQPTQKCGRGARRIHSCSPRRWSSGVWCEKTTSLPTLSHLLSGYSPSPHLCYAVLPVNSIILCVKAHVQKMPRIRNQLKNLIEVSNIPCRCWWQQRIGRGMPLSWTDWRKDAHAQHWHSGRSSTRDCLSILVKCLSNLFTVDPTAPFLKSLLLKRPAA